MIRQFGVNTRREPYIVAILTADHDATMIRLCIVQPHEVLAVESQKNATVSTRVLQNGLIGFRDVRVHPGDGK